MIKQGITIIPTKTNLPVVAGWLPGDDTASWLHEASLFAKRGIPTKGFSVSASMRGITASGMFLVPDSPSAVSFSPRTQPLVEILPRVYTFSGFDLSIGLTIKEQKHLFPHDFHFFHPVYGLVGFERTETINFAGLLALPPESENQWGTAISGPSPAPRFRSISVVQPKPIDDLINEAGSDISSQAHTDPNKGPGGKGGKLGTLGSGIAGGAVLGLSKLSNLFPSNDNQGNESLSQQESNELLQWAQKNWQGLFDARAREVNNLIDKLSKNLDEGLKYALPLSSDGISRGTAPPSTRLPRRSARFSMGGGNGPADYWDLSHEHKLTLEKKYREAALQEIRRGNLPRAAYIYGNLLGDWKEAASALEDAKQFRDAVSIYLHKLNNKSAAAACYQRANMLPQAADLYIELDNFEKAGDLYLEMGDKESARSFWIQAADHENDAFKKAAIWSEKLHHDAVALDILEDHWPKGDRSSNTALEMFRLLERSSTPKTAIKLGNRILNHPKPINGFKLEQQLSFIQEAANRWPSEEIAHWMEQETWQRVAEQVASKKADSSRYLKFLTAITPEDKLLARDAKRYRIPKQPISPFVDKLPEGQIKPKNVIQLPLENAIWMGLTRMDDGVSIVGRCEKITALGFWSERDSSWASQLRKPELPENESFIEHIAIGPDSRNSRILHYLDQHHLYCHTSSKAVRHSNLDQLASITNVLAIAPQLGLSSFLLLRYTETGSLTVLNYTDRGDLNKATPIDLIEPEAKNWHWMIAGTASLTVIASIGVFACCENDQISTLNLAGKSRSLEICPKTGEAFLLVVENEVLLVSYKGVGKPLETINLHTTSEEDRNTLVTCFLTDGSIVIAYSGGGKIYSANNYLKSRSEIVTDPAFHPIGITNCGANQFMLLSSCGSLLHFDFG